MIVVKVFLFNAVQREMYQSKCSQSWHSDTSGHAEAISVKKEKVPKLTTSALQVTDTAQCGPHSAGVTPEGDL